MSIEITKRVEMRKVIGFVVHFLPSGLSPPSRRPLVDAALGLKDNVYNPSISGVRERSFNPYHS